MYPPWWELRQEVGLGSEVKVALKSRDFCLHKQDGRVVQRQVSSTPIA
jgi:hypothetical protein